jgi:RNA polymerase sigma-70 factor, ECF subfamily
VPSDNEGGSRSGRTRPQFISDQDEQKLHSMILKRVKNPQDAWDILQDCYFRFLRYGDTARDALPYLYRIVETQTVDFVVAKKVVSYDSEVVDIELGRLSEGTGDLSDPLSQAEQLREVLAQIPEVYRRVLLMFYDDGFTTPEIAARLNLTETSVRKYIARGKAYARRASVGKGPFK